MCSGDVVFWRCVCGEWRCVLISSLVQKGGLGRGEIGWYKAVLRMGR